MGILGRLSTLIKSNVNDVIDSMQDPGKEIDQMVRDMEDSAREARGEVARCMGEEKRLKRRIEQIEAEAKGWEDKAAAAVRAGDDELAKQALLRQQEHTNLATQFEQQWQQQKVAVDKLKDALRTLNDKVEEAKRKKNILIARKKRAEAQKAIQETMSGLSDTSAFDTFDRMADKIDQLEAEAEAGTELAGEMSGDTLATKFKKLEGTAGADMALAELKAKMGLAPAPSAQGALPAATDRVRMEEDVGVEEKVAVPVGGKEQK